MPLQGPAKHKTNCSFPLMSVLTVINACSSSQIILTFSVSLLDASLSNKVFSDSGARAVLARSAWLVDDLLVEDTFNVVLAFLVREARVVG